MWYGCHWVWKPGKSLNGFLSRLVDRRRIVQYIIISLHRNLIQRFWMSLHFAMTVIPNHFFSFLAYFSVLVLGLESPQSVNHRPSIETTSANENIELPFLPFHNNFVGFCHKTIPYIICRHLPHTRRMLYYV